MANEYNLNSSWAEVDAAAQGYKNGITEDHLSAGVQEKLNREDGGGDTKPAGGWGTNDIADGAVTTAKLANSAVTSAKINSGAVTEAKLGSEAVTNGKIGALAVTTAKLAAGAVTEGKIADNAVTSGKLAAAVQNRLLPAATAADSGKVPTVNSSGVYVLSEPTGGGNVDNVVIVPISNMKAQLTPAIIYQEMVTNGKNIMYYLYDPTTKALARLHKRPDSANAESAEFIWEDTTNRNFVLYSLPASSSSSITTSTVAFDQGGGGGGVELFKVYITNSAGTYTASETVADIMAAYNSGKLVKYYNDVGAEGLLFVTPTMYGISFVCFDDSDGGHPPQMNIYSIAANGTVTVSHEDILNSLILPVSQSRTAAQMASGLMAQSNVVYIITGDATGFVLTNATNPISKAGQCIEIRLAVGSTAITTPTWPSWCNMMNGWDGNFSANTYYDIVIDDAGNVYAGTREVSA